MPFVSLGLSPSLCTPLARLGYTTPTPVQTQSIPVVLSGRDLLARAQTGTGKTAAFGLPMIDRLLVRGGAPAGTRKPRGLVLVPTRELALQVHKSLATYGVPANLRVTAIFGGVSIRPQIQELKRGTDIIVATPGRLLDHMEQRTVDLSAVEILTLDEADRMLDMGFLPPLRRILQALPRKRQTLLFSATISQDVIRLSADFTRRPDARGRVGGTGDGADGDAPRASGVGPAQGRPAHPPADAVAGGPGPGVLPDQARIEPCRRVPRTCRREGGGHPRQQEPGRAHARARRLQGRARERARRHRHRRARARHRAAAARGELRPAARARGLHPPRRAHGPGRPCRSRRVAGVAGGSRPVARHPAPAARAARAGGGGQALP